MFYIRNNTKVQQPYRVDAIEKDRRGGQERSLNQQFSQEDPSSHHEKFLKASKKLLQKKTVILISEMMDRQLVTLRDNLSLEEAWEEIKNHKIQYFPIVDVEGKLLGILSEREILREIQGKKQRTLRELTADRTLCAEPHTELSEVIQVFSVHKLEVLPVVDKERKVVGLLTQNELLHTMLKISKLLPS
ncbi:MAG: Inosine-5'-monophosphate dehydrogenase [Chlamydiae bacterium]|nr:Inosine-5'-monophosphate dehydrogenase [Chlamydiota bacterium]